MIYLGVCLGIGIMSAMIYMALNKKSHFHVRIASIIAIFLMILTIIICLVIAFTDNSVPVDESVLIVGAVVETQPISNNNVMVLFLLVFLLIAIFILIAVLAIREQRKISPKKT